MNTSESQVRQQRFRHSEARLQAAIKLFKLGLYAWNPQTNELQWDETTKAIWGGQGDASIDYETWRSSIHPDDRQLADEALRRCTDPDGDGVYDVEYRVIGKRDGVERWVATRGLTYFDNGKATSFSGVVVDVTDRKRVERALEHRVEERTCELEDVNRRLRSQIEQRQSAEATLRQSQRLQAIGQITAGVVHDFNNLLGIVITNTHILSRKLRDPNVQEGLNLIQRAAERGAKLTAQLLDFSRKQALEPEILDLGAKVAEMKDILNATLGGTMVVSMELAADLWSTFADPTQMELAILNLAINGRDAMQSRGVLTIRTYNTSVEKAPTRPEEPSPGDYAAIAVDDTGIGISADVLPLVFEPFFTTKESGEGTGLGLSQVFGFVKKSNGGVRICSELGKGTSVTLLMPRAALTLRDPERGLGDAERYTSRSKRAATVLVVDDDKAVLESTVRMLQFLDYTAVPAASGEEALRMLTGDREVDVVLADFAMPEMNGVELADDIKAIRPSLPVILVTAYCDRQILKQFRQSRILQKPYSEGDLECKISAVLS